MRTFLNGSGVDVTATVVAYVQSLAGRTPLMADLFELKTFVQGAPWSQDLLLTPSDRPLRWSHKGTFLPANIVRGAVESKISLDTISLEMDWYPAAGAVIYGSLGMLQSFAHGLWDNATVSLWRLIMPTLGDGDTYGACEMFSGRVAQHTFTRMGVHLTINSATELFDQQLPPNVIEASDPQARYGTGQPPAGLTSVPAFAAVAGSTASVVLADETSPNASQIFGDDTFDFGYLWGTGGANTGIFRTIRRQDSYAEHNRFYLYQPFPFPVGAGDTFLGYVPFVRAGSVPITETDTIPNSSPYVIEVASPETFMGDNGVKYHGGGTLTKVANNPQQHQYSVDLTGIYSFSQLDHGDQVDISYNRLLAGFQGFPFVPPPEAAL